YHQGGLCIAGGVTGFARTRSIPSLLVGVGVGALYLYSADSIQKQTANGLETAVGASALLLASSVPRLRKGPMPLMLTAASLGAGSYYAKKTYRVRQYRMADKDFWMTPSNMSKPHEV
ncbi:uncharacterized protein STEHIDRAFT_57297, partial [Stereum hirsutum FP-91666 SS1]|uniref:uncharacterized protein n=1 Tax=Stereum hirsutum (strain FP-91666) TaxID=721885 RepID=UPI000440AADE